MQRDVRSFVENHIPSIAYEDLIRAARVAKDARLYDQVARKEGYHTESDLLVQLTEEEKGALRRERDVPFSEKGMRIVILTVSIAALLQGEHMISHHLLHPFLTSLFPNRLRSIIFQWCWVV